MSDIFYRNLVDVGAPVGALQSTARTLRSANGTGIEVLGCSRCSVSFLGLRTEFPHYHLQPGGGNGRDHWNGRVGVGVAAYTGH